MQRVVLRRIVLGMTVAAWVGGCGMSPAEDPEPEIDGGHGEEPTVDGGPAEPPAEPDAGGGDPPPILPATCPLGPPAQAMIDQIVERMTLDALWVAETSHGTHSGFALFLPGTDEAQNIGSASLAMPCETQLWYDAYCASDDGGGISPGGGSPLPSGGFSETHSSCLRFGCDGPGVYLAQVYFTEKPRTQPDDPHVLTYSTTTVAGTATWDPNPSMTWEMRNVSSSEVRIEGEIDRRVRVALDDGGELALRHTGSVRAVAVSGSVRSLELSLQFPELTAQPLDLRLTIDPGGGVAGTLLEGEVTLATWAGDIHEGVRMTWAGACGD